MSLPEFVETLQEELVAAGDMPATYTDISYLERQTGFKPSTPLCEGVRSFAK